MRAGTSPSPQVLDHATRECTSHRGDRFQNQPCFPNLRKYCCLKTCLWYLKSLLFLKKQYVVVIQPFFSQFYWKTNAKAVMVSTLQLHKTQMWITRGWVLNEELYAQRLHRLIHLHLFTKYFMKIYPQALERFWPLKRNVQEFETVCKQMQLNKLLKSLYTPITAVIDIHTSQEKLFSSRAHDWWDIAW